jgi:hypothetical protein
VWTFGGATANRGSGLRCKTVPSKSKLAKAANK